MNIHGVNKKMGDEEKIAEKNLVEANMAEMKIARAPDLLVTRGLGSCLGIVLYDPIKKIGAIAHPMLPDIEKARNKSNPARFVNSVIEKMVEGLRKEGCLKKNLVAKLFGGAHMFSFISQDSILNVGENNIVMAKEMFEQLGIEVAGEELRGSAGRTVVLDLETGRVCVKTIAAGEKEV